MDITWTENNPLQVEGADDKKAYALLVTQNHRSKTWHWSVYRDEDRIITSIYEDKPYFSTADEAKARAEKALEDYLNEQNDFTNTLREVLRVEKPTQLENDDFVKQWNFDRLKFYYDKP